MRLRADFNGLFGDLLCLSHTDSSEAEDGTKVWLNEGMTVTAFDDDVDARGQSDKLLASGIVERSPQWLGCNGSRWVLRIDRHGVRHESDGPPTS
jgi:hypothetical protein